ncbi:TetR family transcriptional regulator [Nonomuraea ferruginea]
MTGLRELQRRRVRETISAAAIRLFLERGFGEVPVTEVAAAAQVSKPTLFKYFPTKEDLVLHRIADHQGEGARVVRARAPGEGPLEALRRHFLDGLARRDPVTGLNDDPEVMGFHRMVFTTPGLAARLSHHTAQDEAALAEALAETVGELTASLVAKPGPDRPPHPRPPQLAGPVSRRPPPWPSRSRRPSAPPGTPTPCCACDPGAGQPIHVSCRRSHTGAPPSARSTADDRRPRPPCHSSYEATTNDPSPATTRMSRISATSPGAVPYAASTSASTRSRASARPSGVTIVKAGPCAPANRANSSRAAVPASHRSMTW